MRRWQTVRFLLCGFAVTLATSACGDDNKGPEVSEDTAWRIGCTRRGGDCSLAQDPHGGQERAGALEAECYTDAKRLNITVTDPGRKGESVKGIARSVLEVTKVNVEKNECYVRVTEYPRDTGNQLRHLDRCKGNAEDPGSCEITGDMNAGGYDFNGTIFCDGMKINGTSDPDFSLEKPDEEGGSPVTLQIRSCN